MRKPPQMPRLRRTAREARRRPMRRLRRKRKSEICRPAGAATALQPWVSTHGRQCDKFDASRAAATLMLCRRCAAYRVICALDSVGSRPRLSDFAASRLAQSRSNVCPGKGVLKCPQHSSAGVFADGGGAAGPLESRRRRRFSRRRKPIRPSSWAKASTSTKCMHNWPQLPDQYHVADDARCGVRQGRQPVRDPRRAQGQAGSPGDLRVRRRRQVHPLVRQGVSRRRPRARSARGKRRGVSVRHRVSGAQEVRQADAQGRNGLGAARADGVGHLREGRGHEADRRLGPRSVHADEHRVLSGRQGLLRGRWLRRVRDSHVRSRRQLQIDVRQAGQGGRPVRVAARRVDRHPAGPRAVAWSSPIA